MAKIKGGVQINVTYNQLKNYLLNGKPLEEDDDFVHKTKEKIKKKNTKKFKSESE